jgi:hypothetical protein
MSWAFSQAGAGRQIECGEEKRANAYGDKKNVEHSEILFGGGGSSKLYRTQIFAAPQMPGLPLMRKASRRETGERCGFDTFFDIGSSAVHDAIYKNYIYTAARSFPLQFGKPLILRT